MKKKTYKKILSLRFGEANHLIRQLKKNEPENLLIPFIENYLDFFTVFVNDNPGEYKRLSKNITARLTQIARGNRKSPWYLYAQAEIRLQWGILHSRQGHYLRALSDIKQGYALLEQNQREHPEFVANKKSLGALHALVGNVPDAFRWALRALGGMKGTVGQGLQELEEVLEYSTRHEFLFETEARVAYAFLQLHLQNEKEVAWKTFVSHRINPDESPLSAYALASLAIRTGRNDTAILLLENCPKGDAYHPFHYRDYLLGIAKLNRLDRDADAPLLRFVKQFKGESGIKEAYQKLAWHRLISGNPEGYLDFMNLVKNKGDDRTEPDKAALAEAQSGDIPDAVLTKARLLFDGGYYDRAYALLKTVQKNYTGQDKSAITYRYRRGRVADAMGKTGEAIRLYSETVQLGAEKPWYFACNAALQLGLIYEKQGHRGNARAAFRRCLTMNPDAYAGSLHAKAKAGLKRVKGG